jgi:hypothetical protein
MPGLLQLQWWREADAWMDQNFMMHWCDSMQQDSTFLICSYLIST